MRHLFVINPHSFFRGRDQLRFIDKLMDSGIKPDVHISRYVREAVVFTRKYLAEQDSSERVRIYAVGGDGILYDCLNGIMTSGRTDAELAAIPYGASNDVVRALVFEADLAAGQQKQILPITKSFEVFRDIDEQINAPCVEIDVLKANKRYALASLGIGVIAASALNYRRYGRKVRDISLNRNMYEKFVNLLFFAGALSPVFKRKFTNQYFTIDLDGKSFSGSYITGAVSNGRFLGNGVFISPNARIDDGLLDCAFVKTPKSRRGEKIDLLKISATAKDFTSGKGRFHPDLVRFYRAKHIRIASPEPILINLDGEVFSEPVLDISVMPKALRFAIPKKAGSLRHA